MTASPAGALLRSAPTPALPNGVLAQNHQAMPGAAIRRHIAGAQRNTALIQQDHDSPVSYRIISRRSLNRAAIEQDLGKDGK